uniref:PWWP domain containing 2A n=1 Tax=Xiphophorus couchianus TaxID=32473 RepID=A0A3B5MIF0_9TELE
MAAVAAEPGAAVPTTTRSEILPEPGPYSPAHHEIPAEPSDGPESSPGGNPDNGESRESRHVGPEQNPGAGPVLPATDRTIEGQLDRSGTTEDVLNRSGVHPEQTATTGLSNLPVDCSGSERVFPGLPNSGSTSTYQTIPLDPQPPAVFLHSVPDPAPVSEAGLSLAEPAEPTETTELDRCYTILEQEELVPGPTEDSVLDENSESQPCGPKPPPLFQEGAPYPPPLFIRDTYHQALPQPPPRKIKRPKRRYRSEEPTSIMNAIKLRPRQVLCDKCKGVVASGGHREARRGEEATRRRRPADAPMSSELKRLKMDDKSGRSTDKRSSGLQGPQSSRRVLRGVVSSSSSTAASGRMRLQLNSKKGLTPAADRPDARKVLQKLAPHRRPKDQNQDRGKAVTRAATLQNHGQKVHFPRRLQNPGGATVPGPLPPRMRLKPQ